MMHLFRYFFAFALLFPCAGHAAEPTLPDIFSSGMVLQRDMPIPVWGTADDGTEVTVTLGEAKATATAAGGKWRVELPARKATTDPLTMKVTFKGSEKEFMANDILVGEVWLCAGQSNMAQNINKKPPRELAEMPQVRQFTRKRGKESKDPPSWLPAVGEDVSHMSITAIYFGENLHKELGVPVGLILTAVSGTPIEEWTPRATLEADADTKAKIDQAMDRETRKKMNEIRKQMREDKTVEMPAELGVLQNLTRPGRLYSQHIEPTVPFAIRGVIWYQGEANSKEPGNAKLYGKYLAMLIAGLREVYGQKDLPFYVVQLPSIEEKDRNRPYQLTREEQRKTTQATPHTGLAVTIDIDEGLHPRSKNITGDRLASLALAEVYGKKPEGGAYGGPLLKSVTFQGPEAICSFEHAEGGLVLKDAGENLFEISGADGKFHPATATVEGDKLKVKSDQVKEAKAVRYAYKPDMRKVSLYGATDIPASPFSFP